MEQEIINFKKELKELLKKYDANFDVEVSMERDYGFEYTNKEIVLYLKQKEILRADGFLSHQYL